MAKSKVCNAVPDCPDMKLDESIQCTTCPDNFCKNEGQCSKYESGANCTCADKYSGYRCAIQAASPAASKQADKTTIGLSVAGGVLFVGLVLVAAYFVIKRKRTAEMKSLTAGVENPAYDMQLGDMSTSAPFNDSTMQPMSELGMENPLYGTLDD